MYEVTVWSALSGLGEFTVGVSLIFLFGHGSTFSSGHCSMFSYGSRDEVHDNERFVLMFDQWFTWHVWYILLTYRFFTGIHTSWLLLESVSSSSGASLLWRSAKYYTPMGLSLTSEYGNTAFSLEKSPMAGPRRDQERLVAGNGQFVGIASFDESPCCNSPSRPSSLSFSPLVGVDEW